MKIDGGYYIKARKIQESKIATAPPHVREIWDWLIKEVNHKSIGKFKRGQTMRSLKDIQEGLKWYVGYRKMMYSKSKCEMAMNWLRKETMIETTKTTRGMIITICNYDTYQNPKNYETNNEKITKATRTKQTHDTINKNDNNDNNDNKRDLLKKTENIIMLDNDFLEFWKIYDMDIQQDKCYEQWKYIDIMNRELILKRLPNYIDNTEKNFRKEPLKYLRNKMWLDEVVIRKPAKQTTQRNNIQEFKPIRTY